MRNVEIERDKNEDTKRERNIDREKIRENYIHRERAGERER